MTHQDETWVPVSDEPQMWWRIVCTYDGKPGSVAGAAGSTADEARTAFLESLAEPHLALIEEISFIGFCEVTDAMQDIWG